MDKKNKHLTNNQWLWGCGEFFLHSLLPRWPRALIIMQSSNLLIPKSRKNSSVNNTLSPIMLVFFVDESPRGASVLLSSLWQDLRPEAGPEGAPGPPHRRKTLHLRALWQGFRTPSLPTHPPPPSLQQNDLHAASEGTLCCWSQDQHANVCLTV